jgi:plastocyanin
MLALGCSNGTRQTPEGITPTAGSAIAAAVEQPSATAPPAQTSTPDAAPTVTSTVAAPTGFQATTQRPAPAPTSPPPAVAPQPVTLTVVAKDLKFSPGTLSVPAHAVVTLVMRNEDSGVLHDLGVNVVGGGRTDTCSGPCTSSFGFAAHVPGSYHFFCSLHPDMVGELKVTP